MWASHIYCIVSFPLRCQSGTFLFFFLFVTFCSFFEEFDQVKSMHIYIKEYKKHSGYKKCIVFLVKSTKKIKLKTQLGH